MSRARVIKIVNGPTLVQVQQQHTLLEELEYQLLQPQYQCRQGFCGCCQVRLLAGEVDYIEEPLAFVRDGYVLSCCCQLKDNITIELPDDTDPTSSA